VKERERKIRNVLLSTLFLNMLVSASKIIYGYRGGSISILSDGFHSLFDGLSNVAGILGIYVSIQPPDEGHPYGHRKYETIFALFVSMLLFVSCLEILKGSYRSLRGSLEPEVGKGAFFLMGSTILINLFVTLYEKRRGRELRSEYLMADATHTLADVYISSGVVAALVLCRLGFAIADGLVGIGVGVLVVGAGIGVLKETVGTLVDKRRLPYGLVRRIVCDVEGVKGCHGIRTRGTKDHIFMDLHILVDPALSVDQAHRIADNVEMYIRQRLPEVRDVVVHIEPRDGEHG